MCTDAKRLVRTCLVRWPRLPSATMVLGVFLIFGYGMPQVVPRMVCAQEEDVPKHGSLDDFRQQLQRPDRMDAEDAKFSIYAIIWAPLLLLFALFFALWLRGGDQQESFDSTAVVRKSGSKLAGRYEKEQHYGSDDFNQY